MNLCCMTPNFKPLNECPAAPSRSAVAQRLCLCSCWELHSVPLRRNLLLRAPTQGGSSECERPLLCQLLISRAAAFVGLKLGTLT